MDINKMSYFELKEMRKDIMKEWDSYNIQYNQPGADKKLISEIIEEKNFIKIIEKIDKQLNMI